MRILTILMFLSVNFFVEASNYDSLFITGNELYIKNKFDEAIKLYEEIIDSGYVSADLYYNLGNAYYKSGKYSYAILNYEKALLYEPNNKNVKYNLQLAKLHTIDKIDEIPTFFLKTWFLSFVKLLPPNTWAYLSIILFFLFVVSVILYMVLENKLKTFSGYLIVIFLLLSIISFICAGKRKQIITEGKYAIIVEPVVNIKSSPDDYGKDVFVLHEGTKVEILESVSEWKNIRISDGNEGYIHSKSLEIIK